MNTERIAKRMLRNPAQKNSARLEKLLALVLRAKSLTWFFGLALAGLMVFGGFAIFGFTFLSRGHW